MSRFGSTLNYSSVNEDWRTEARALGAGPGARVLAITGGGRPLDLLLSGPERVVAIDAVAAQSALLALEVAAMRALEYDAYAAFLGLTPATRTERGRVLDGLLSRLDAEAGAFWASHRSLVEEGVLSTGRWERFFRMGSRVGRLVRPGKIRRLFAFEDLEVQRAFVRKQWDTPCWRWLHDALLSRLVLRHLLGDPAFHAHVAVHPGRFVRERMQASLLSVLAQDNFMVNLTLRGRLGARDLPPRLTREGVAAIRERLDRLQIVTGDVIAHLEGVGPGTYTHFSLSDVPSYLSQEDFERLLDGVARAGAPGARFCIRLFLSRPRFPDRHAAVLVREPGLEARLAREDHAFAYDFIVGSLAR